jgi:hypothetical protein
MRVVPGGDPGPVPWSPPGHLTWWGAGSAAMAAAAGPNVLLIPGTGSVAHLRENLAAEGMTLDDESLRQSDRVSA